MKKLPTFKGYVIGRKLIDDDGKLKNFTYYPHKEHGIPPYHFKTKIQAQKSFKRREEYFKGMSFGKPAIFKFTKRTYLDRY